MIREKNILADQGNTIEEFKQAIADIGKYSRETNENVNEALEEITNGIDYMRKLTEKRNLSGGK